VHNDGFNFATHTWFDQIPPGSVPAQGNPSVANFFNTTDDTMQIVYLGQDGFVHNDGFNFTTGIWFDQIPPGSVAAHGSPTIAIFNIATGDTFHVVYVGKDGLVHNDGYDPTTGTWFDQIPPGSVKALGPQRPR
jgi:phage terminase large subunit-like protein